MHVNATVFLGKLLGLHCIIVAAVMGTHVSFIA
jgi:hypothetical protein